MIEVKREHLAGLYRVADAVEGRSSIRKNGMIDGHILLRDIREWIAQASAAPEQEPVGYQFRMKTVLPGSEWTPWKECAEAEYLMFCNDPGPSQAGVMREVRKFYTHADPAEVERLRERLEAFKKSLADERDLKETATAELNHALQQIDFKDEAISQYRDEIEAAIQRADAAERKLGDLLKELESAVIDWDRYSLQAGQVTGGCHVAISMERSQEGQFVRYTDLLHERRLIQKAMQAASAEPAECQHRFMYFGDQPARRCADCNKVEPAKGGDGEVDHA